MPGTIEEEVAMQSIKNAKINNSFSYTLTRLYTTKHLTNRSISLLKRMRFDTKMIFYLTKIAQSERTQQELWMLLELMGAIVEEFKKDKTSVKQLIKGTNSLIRVGNMDCNERICEMLDAIESKAEALYRIATDEAERIKIQLYGINYIPCNKNEEDYTAAKKKIEELSLSLGIKSLQN